MCQTVITIERRKGREGSEVGIKGREGGKEVGDEGKGGKVRRYGD